MTDVRRTGPPERLADRMHIGIPIDGEVDSIWTRAMHAEVIEGIRTGADLPESDFFGRSLTINPKQIKFVFNVNADLLPRYLDIIEAAIPRANEAAQVRRDKLNETVSGAARELKDRDEQIGEEMTSWSQKRPVASTA